MAVKICLILMEFILVVCRGEKAYECLPNPDMRFNLPISCDSGKLIRNIILEFKVAIPGECLNDTCCPNMTNPASCEIVMPNEEEFYQNITGKCDGQTTCRHTARPRGWKRAKNCTMIGQYHRFNLTNFLLATYDCLANATSRKVPPMNGSADEESPFNRTLASSIVGGIVCAILLLTLAIFVIFKSKRLVDMKRRLDDLKPYETTPPVYMEAVDYTTISVPSSPVSDTIYEQAYSTDSTYTNAASFRTNITSKQTPFPDPDDRTSHVYGNLLENQYSDVCSNLYDVAEQIRKIGTDDNFGNYNIAEPVRIDKVTDVSGNFIVESVVSDAEINDDEQILIENSLYDSRN